jgi:predicted DNA-binding helix-hairpin-helix protein
LLVLDTINRQINHLRRKRIDHRFDGHMHMPMIDYGSRQRVTIDAGNQCMCR